MKAFSWEMVNDNIALKCCDKTVFRGGESVIPQGKIQAYWGLNEADKGKKRR